MFSLLSRIAEIQQWAAGVGLAWGDGQVVLDQGNTQAVGARLSREYRPPKAAIPDAFKLASSWLMQLLNSLGVNTKQGV